MKRRSAPILRFLCCACSLASATPVRGQAPAVALTIRPRAGDTLRLRLDQTVEIAGTRRNADVDVTTSELHTMMVLTRIAVESTDLEGATVTAMTDTVRLTSSNGTAGESLMGWAKVMQGQRFRFRVQTDGSTSLVDAREGGPQMAAFLAQLPASLPKDPIAQGATWTRTMDIPTSAIADARGAATMTATFRFDSLTRGGDLAHLSVRGRLTRESAPPKGAVAPTVEMNGTLTGTVLVDRRRGWITEMRSAVVVRSLLLSTKGDSPPLRVRLKITQWMRAE